MTSTDPANLSPDERAAAMLADLDAIKPTMGGQTCRAQAAVDSLPPVVQRAFHVVEARKTTAAGALAAFLNEWAPGFEVSDGIMARHRRRGTVTGCKCPPGGAL